MFFLFNTCERWDYMCDWFQNKISPSSINIFISAFKLIDPNVIKRFYMNAFVWCPHKANMDFVIADGD